MWENFQWQFPHKHDNIPNSVLCSLTTFGAGLQQNCQFQWFQSLTPLLAAVVADFWSSQFLCVSQFNLPWICLLLYFTIIHCLQQTQHTNCLFKKASIFSNKSSGLNTTSPLYSNSVKISNLIKEWLPNLRFWSCHIGFADIKRCT